ncbi:MAG: MBL fold metallo-hydrolase [Gemmataceae bacterium]
MSSVAPAASILLAQSFESREVLLVRRSDQLRFFGGFWAFPGGKVDPTDSELTDYVKMPQDWSEEKAIRCVTVVRELFEETGVLIARCHDDSFLKSEQLDRLREPLIANEISFRFLLDELQLRIVGQDFLVIGDITTPAFTSMRFDTTFFVGHLPPGQTPSLVEGELVDIRWTRPADMLDVWGRGECFLSPPTVMTLEAVRDALPSDAPNLLAPAYESYQRGAIHPIFFAPYVQLIPLRTQSLPPSEYTNAFLVGRDTAYLIDPGPDDPDEQEKLFAVLDERITSGIDVKGIVLTHQHPDHIGAANACRQRYDLPIWAHPITAEKIKNTIPVDHTIQHGDSLSLGACPNGSARWELEAIHTPGHAAGHLAFYDPQYQLMFAADMVSPQTSMIIAPPDGDIQIYLESLHKLHSYAMTLLLPSHGMPTSQPHHLLQQAVKHREKREKLLVEALRGRPQSIREMVPDLYKGIPEHLLRLAELQTQAGLIKLRNEGKVEQVGERWQLTDVD